MKSLKCFVAIILAVVLLAQLTTTVESAPQTTILPEPYASPSASPGAPSGASPTAKQGVLKTLVQGLTGNKSSEESHSNESSEEGFRPLIARKPKKTY